MEKIIKYHERILDHLISIRETNSELYFVPRKINNKQRLDKGYWFLGNEQYLHLSFWKGEDWKEKIHNIGFVVLSNGTSYIEFSAQDSITKARFLETVASKLGGFKKNGDRNKWFKYYSGTDYIACLDDFIENVKPAIDALVKKGNTGGVELIDFDFFEKYANRVIVKRRQHIESGKKNKLSRLCWNTKNWKFPSGTEGKSIADGSYETDAGYGHEEWLFDKTRIIDGYHYAFLQPLFLKSNKHENAIYNISLFTSNNLNKHYYVGEIKNVECITKVESSQVYDVYKGLNWINQMKTDVIKAGGNYPDFMATKPEAFFNIRFKFKDLHRPDELLEISNDDISLTTHRYKLLPRKAKIEIAKTKDDSENESEGKKKNTKMRTRVFNGECEYDPYHDRMQNALHEHLKKSDKYNYKKVCIEKGRVDLKGLTEENRWHYFELKTDNAKHSIRQALGQILEYAYYPDMEKAEKLIIVADEEPSKDVIAYLNHIRAKFKLPISYRYFDIEKNELSDDY